MGFITVGNESSVAVEFYYEDQGTDQPVVLIHGYPPDGHSWERQASELVAAGYRVIAYDDNILPIDVTARRFRQKMPDAEYVEIQGAPHGLLWTHVEEVNTALLTFLGLGRG